MPGKPDREDSASYSPKKHFDRSKNFCFHLLTRTVLGLKASNANVYGFELF